MFFSEGNSYYEKFPDGRVVCIDDEIPFEVPQSWEWIRLGSIVDFSKSGSVKSSVIGDDAWILDLEDIEKDTGKLLQKKRMRDLKSKSDKHPFSKGDVLYSKLRPYLNKVIIADKVYCFIFSATPLLSAKTWKCRRRSYRCRGQHSTTRPPTRSR